MRSEPFGVDRAACFEELADVFASCGALHYAKILASLKIKKGISSHKKCHFFVRGFQIMDQKRHFEPQTAILAKKWLDSFARIAGCFFCRSKNMASSPYHKDDKTKFTNLPFPLIRKELTFVYPIEGCGKTRTKLTAWINFGHFCPKLQLLKRILGNAMQHLYIALSLNTLITSNITSNPVGQNAPPDQVLTTCMSRGYMSIIFTLIFQD